MADQNISEKRSAADTADLHIQNGCPACGGDLEVRALPGTTYAYCRTCLVLSKPRIAVGMSGVKVTHKAAAA